MLTLLTLGMAAMCALPAPSTPADRTVVATSAYRWVGDTLYQNEFKAWAQSPEEIRSTYHGRPGYGFPVEQTWKRRNDLSAYPVLSDPNRLLTAVYNMGLDEMVNAVEPDTTLRTGKEWAGVWTRDVSYSIILSMAALQPEASMISLRRKVNAQGQIVQDTGSGGAWPISTDRMVWVLAAYEVYKATGDRKWLEYAYPVAVRSIDKDAATIMSDNGLVKGETSFIDWREQSYPGWMQTVDISQSEAMGTNVMYAAALQAVADMAADLGKKKEAADFSSRSIAMADAIEKRFASPGKGYLGMYTYGRDNLILNPRAETLGESLAILYDIASPERAVAISESNPVTPFGPAIFYPQIADMPNYHNNALWPFVAAYWTLAQAKAGNEQGVMEGIGSIVRPAALFATNKENFNLDNGDYFTELNSSNMLWSLAGNLAVTQRILFGLHFEKNGLRIAPFIPEALSADRSLRNFPYRGARINISVEGYGDSVKELYLNGKRIDPLAVIPASQLAKGGEIRVVMDNQPIPAMALNRVANRKAPLTPLTRIEEDPAFGTVLRWNPIEYIAGYIVLLDGKEVGRTRQTQWPVTATGEWQVIGYDAEGVQSFASQPADNRKTTVVQPLLTVATPASSEISYPAESVTGFSGSGFAETDHSSAPATFEVETPHRAKYSLSLRYSNGNGPVNTENKAAIRTLFIDGVPAGTVVMPQRGVANWNDWGFSNSVTVDLTPGHHTVELRFLPENENMNLHTNHALVDALYIREN